MTTEAKVGIFVLVCTLILGSALIALIAPQLHSSMVPYHTYLRYAGGLAPGGNVLFGGITAGRITSVRPDLRNFGKKHGGRGQIIDQGLYTIRVEREPPD